MVYRFVSFGHGARHTWTCVSCLHVSNMPTFVREKCLTNHRSWVQFFKLYLKKVCIQFHQILTVSTWYTLWFLACFTLEHTDFSQYLPSLLDLFLLFVAINFTCIYYGNLCLCQYVRPIMLYGMFCSLIYSKSFRTIQSILEHLLYSFILHFFLYLWYILRPPRYGSEQGL